MQSDKPNRAGRCWACVVCWVLCDVAGRGSACRLCVQGWVGGWVRNKLVRVTSQNLANLWAVEDRGDPPFRVEGPPARMMRSFDHAQGHQDRIRIIQCTISSDFSVRCCSSSVGRNRPVSRGNPTQLRHLTPTPAPLPRAPQVDAARRASPRTARRRVPETVACALGSAPQVTGLAFHAP